MSFCLPAFLGPTIGYWAAPGQDPIVKFSLLAFTAGILTTVVVENMVPEAAEKEKETYLETFVFVSGFALFTLLCLRWSNDDWQRVNNTESTATTIDI